MLSWGHDEQAQWLATTSVPGGHAVGDTWRARRPEAIQAIATGLRAIHAITIHDFPAEWTAQSWVGRTPASLGPRPDLADPVLVHGDACAPNTLVSAAGEWTGNVDFGDLAVGGRWADLAIASMSLDWSFGEGHQTEPYVPMGWTPTQSGSTTTARSGTSSRRPPACCRRPRPTWYHSGTVRAWR